MSVQIVTLVYTVTVKTLQEHTLVPVTVDTLEQTVIKVRSKTNSCNAYWIPYI